MKLPDLACIATIIAAVTLPIGAVAEPEGFNPRAQLRTGKDTTSLGDPCTSLLKECFNYGENEFSQCLFSSGHHPFCEGLELGDLALKRFATSATQTDPETEALLGPSLVDQQCLTNFDSQFSAELIRGSLSNERVRSLTQSLERCRRTPTEPLFRP